MGTLTDQLSILIFYFEDLDALNDRSIRQMVAIEHRERPTILGCYYFVLFMNRHETQG